MNPYSATLNVAVSNFNDPAGSCSCQLSVSDCTPGASVDIGSNQGITVTVPAGNQMTLNFQMASAGYSFVSLAITGDDFVVPAPSNDGQTISVTDEDVAADVGIDYAYSITISNGTVQCTFDPRIETEN